MTHDGHSIGNTALGEKEIYVSLHIHVITVVYLTKLTFASCSLTK